MIKKVKRVVKDAVDYKTLIGDPFYSDNIVVGFRFWNSGYYVNDPVYVYATDVNEDSLSRASLLDTNCRFINSDECIEGDLVENQKDFFESEEAFQRALNEVKDNDNKEMALIGKDGYLIGYQDEYTYLDRSEYDASNGYLLVTNMKTIVEKRDENNETQNEFFAKFNQE